MFSKNIDMRTKCGMYTVYIYTIYERKKERTNKRMEENINRNSEITESTRERT